MILGTSLIVNTVVKFDCIVSHSAFICRNLCANYANYAIIHCAGVRYVISPKRSFSGVCHGMAGVTAIMAYVVPGDLLRVFSSITIHYRKKTCVLRSACLPLHESGQSSPRRHPLLARNALCPYIIVTYYHSATVPCHMFT